MDLEFPHFLFFNRFEWGTHFPTPKDIVRFGSEFSVLDVRPTVWGVFDIGLILGSVGFPQTRAVRIREQKQRN